MSGMYLSVDFEDFSHDLKRQLGLWETGQVRVEQLWKKYHRISDLLKPTGSKITFFCVGILADHCPDLIKKIADDGHEVACHHYFHDDLEVLTSRQIEYDFSQAIEKLQSASNSRVIGFRAPRFKINKSSPEQYMLVQKHFDYDSSFFCADLDTVDHFKNSLGLDKLHIFPIFEGRLKQIPRKVKTGGTFFKFMPQSLNKRLFKDCEAAGLVPHLYIHPYEVGSGSGFRNSWNDLIGLSTTKRIYWLGRQMQWLDFGNGRVEKNIAELIAYFPLRGRLCDALPARPV